MALDISSYLSKIEDKTLKITIVGLGKMGLPIALVFTHAGYEVTGYDISENVVDGLNNGRSHIDREPYIQERLDSAIENNNFHATSDLHEAIQGTDIVITIIPVLDNDQGEQDLSTLKSLYKRYVELAMNDILFIQESTLAPGTCKNELWPIISSKHLSHNYGLVFAPERTFSGRAIDDIEKHYPKLVGGVNHEDGVIAASLYEKVAQKGVIALSNATTAEAVKTFKGAYRDINIALANQFAVMADKFGVDIIEVINAANTEPSSHIHTPGIGVGGHCIPVYPKFLIHNSSELGYEPDLLIQSRLINDLMVEYAVDILRDYNPDWTNVLVLGLAYRGGVKEYRNSPTLRLVPSLRAEKVKVSVSDPLYSKSEIDLLLGNSIGINFDDVNYEEFDTVIITADHHEFKELGEKLEGKHVYDGRYVIDAKKAENMYLYQPGRLNLKSE